ncbi:hypothetical protein LV82_02503 [Albidovulum inexpectatum]|uniref:Yip1-like protein n=1 Tax=Albidovulum inexpectatum TaxID=196587 RepID=A0A2S5JDX1_9RHOB|nr:YIP1 family protein [Albidovulum inexpectatum]PPB79712.1 hypothetical protein LV82_02503 [Albidovulum inexpectatum]
MAVTDDIVATYRGPRVVFARILRGERHEARPLTYLIFALLIFYVAQWPALARAAHLQPEIPLTQRMFAAFLATLAALPVFYLLALLGRLAARLAGRRIAGYEARVALFWALLAVSPLVLLHGLVRGFLGPGLQAGLVGLAVFAVFACFWWAGLSAAARGRE